MAGHVVSQARCFLFTRITVHFPDWVKDGVRARPGKTRRLHEPALDAWNGPRDYADYVTTLIEVY